VAHLVARTNKNVAHPRIDAIHRDWAGDRPWTGRQAQTFAWLRLKRSQDRPLLQCDLSIDRPAVFRAEQLRGGSSYVAPINTENLLHVLQSAQFCRSNSEQNAIRTESYWSEARIRLNGWLRVRRDCVLFRPETGKIEQTAISTSRPLGLRGRITSKEGFLYLKYWNLPAILHSGFARTSPLTAASALSSRSAVCPGQ